MSWGRPGAVLPVPRSRPTDRRACPLPDLSVRSECLASALEVGLRWVYGAGRRRWVAGVCGVTGGLNSTSCALFVPFWGWQVRCSTKEECPHLRENRSGRSVVVGPGRRSSKRDHNLHPSPRLNRAFILFGRQSNIVAPDENRKSISTRNRRPKGRRFRFSGVADEPELIATSNEAFHEHSRCSFLNMPSWRWRESNPPRWGSVPSWSEARYLSLTCGNA